MDRPQYTPQQARHAEERKEVLKRINAKDLLATAVNGGNIIEVEQVAHTIFHSETEPNGEYFINGYFDVVSRMGIFCNSVVTERYGTELMVGVGYAQAYTLDDKITHAAAMARMFVGEVATCTGNLVEGGIERVFGTAVYSGKIYRSYYTFDMIKALIQEKLQDFQQNKGQFWQKYLSEVVGRQQEDEKRRR